jgi:hypothetical protein
MQLTELSNKSLFIEPSVLLIGPLTGPGGGR